eukprot:15326346-Ditylum_brightwellii.AAC.1
MQKATLWTNMTTNWKDRRQHHSRVCLYLCGAKGNTMNQNNNQLEDEEAVPKQSNAMNQNNNQPEDHNNLLLPLDSYLSTVVGVEAAMDSIGGAEW